MFDQMTILARLTKEKKPHPAKYYQAWQCGVVVAEGSWPMCKHLTKNMKGVIVLGVRV